MEDSDSGISNNCIHSLKSPDIDNDEDSLTKTPQRLATVNFDTYTCGVAWSARGNTCAVSTETRVHVYDHEEGALRYRDSIRHAECLYSWEWGGGGDCILTTGRYQPVHLYRVPDTGGLQLEDTYKCINHLDELAHAHSVTMDARGEAIYCGLKSEVRVFDVRRPGRESDSHVTRDTGGGQQGIISCLATSPTIPVYAAGSYDRTVGLYTSQGERLCVLRGQQGGLTQLTFSEDGGKLLAGGRKDNEIICWDLRRPGEVLWTVHRVVTTNQTVAFSLRGRWLVSGNTDGSVRLWDTGAGHVDPDTSHVVLAPRRGWALHGDAVTGVAWHPAHTDTLATATGQRHFALESAEEDEEEMEENSLVIWDTKNAF